MQDSYLNSTHILHNAEELICQNYNYLQVLQVLNNGECRFKCVIFVIYFVFFILLIKCKH